MQCSNVIDFESNHSSSPHDSYQRLCQDRQSGFVGVEHNILALLVQLRDPSDIGDFQFCHFRKHCTQLLSE